MKIIVSVKVVPDTAAKMTVEGGKVSWGDAPLVINPWDEWAVEAALLQQEAYGGSVTAISVGGEEAKEALKHALAMGCTDAILISDPALAGADSLAVSHVLASAIKKISQGESVDLAVFGRQAVDGDMGVTPAQTARLLGWPAVTLVSKIDAMDEGACSIKAERTIEEGRQTVTSKLPVVISVVKDIGEPRYPSFMGIRKAARATIPTWTLADLDISAPKPAVHWPAIMPPPAREVKVEMITGGSPHEIAEKLADKILSEKVL